MTYFNPEDWLETTVRALKEYVEAGFNNAVRDDTNAPVGLEIYSVIMEFPTAIATDQKVPLAKTTVHLEIDDIKTMPIGFGENIFRDNYDDSVPGSETVRPQEAKQHRINFDIGIWTSDRAGGTTQRMRAFQVLENLFAGGRANRALYNASSNGDGGIEIIEYTGGRFITERVGDVVTYRSVDGQLEVRVFSRTPMGAPEPAITTIGQAPGLSII